MSITYLEALTQLEALTAKGGVATQQELRNLANSVSVYAEGSVKVLYGGDLFDGVSAGSVVAQMAANDSNLRVISKTDAAKFLENIDFRMAIATSFGVTLDEVDGVGVFKGTPANNFLHGTYGLWPRL